VANPVDDLAKAAAAGVSRRRFLRMAAGAAIAATPLVPVSAPKPKPTKCKPACGHCDNCVNGVCVPKCDPDKCLGCVPLTMGGTVCVEKCPGECRICVARTCANACSGGEVCCGSELVGAPPVCCPGAPPFRCCGTTCVNTDVDDQNCGACGNSCQGGKACNGFGTCACPIGQQDCNGTCIPESEVCCPPTMTVMGAGAALAVCGDVCCGAPNTCCSNRCVNTSSDTANCGSCGNACPPLHECSGGVCVNPCGSDKPCPNAAGTLGGCCGDPAVCFLFAGGGAGCCRPGCHTPDICRPFGGADPICCQSCAPGQQLINCQCV
jgi:hypothetical protein